MSRTTRIVVCLLAALSPVPSAAHAAGPGLQISWSPTPNYTRANRPASMIRLIVVHSTGGSYFGSIKWLQEPRAQASANYVVSRTGSVTQMVRDSDIAWHAGNWAVNRESIGVEHEGYVGVQGSYTDAEYRASAKLTGWIARTHLLPIDRKHFIGHSEVPDPNHPGQFGGFAHHTDPGRYWDWSRYLGYVRAYAHGAAPPTFHAPKPAAPPAVLVRKTAPGKSGGTGTAVGPIFAFRGLQPGKGLAGFVPWQADVSGKDVSRVEFLVDGQLRSSATRPPFAFGGGGGALDTTQLPNGPHVLAIRVVATNGKVTGSSVRVGIVNMPFQVQVAAPANAQTVSGRVRLVAALSGGVADHVDFVVDGRVDQTERAAPFEDSWDTTKLANGPHTLTLRAVAQDGRVATAAATVVVANAAKAPTPAPSGSIAIRGLSLRDGQTVAGAVLISADVRGRAVDRVEFSIDGVARWVEHGAPYVFGGDDGRWDTTAEANGRHVVSVRAVAGDGADATQTVVVTVANRVAPPLAIALPLQPGQVVSGSVHLVASVEGQARRVEFYVDGRLQHVENTAPYEYDLDTSELSSGAHNLLAKAVGYGQTATASDDLTVEGLSLSSSLVEGAVLSGTAHVDATVTGAADRVELRVDGRLVQTDSAAPFGFDLDTTRLADGAHTVALTAVSGARTAMTTAHVTTKNAIAPVVTLSLADGALASRSVHVVAATVGPVRRVEFLVDGTLRHVEQSAPYEFDWDTRAERDGRHVLVARAVGDGGSGSASATVTVQNAPAPAVTTSSATTSTTSTSTSTAATTSSSTSSTTTTTTSTTTTAPAEPASVTTNLVDGQAAAGVVHVVATVAGVVPRRVDFYVDGRDVHAERDAPYELDWDTRRLAPGRHLLGVLVLGRGGIAAQTSVTVVVGP